MPCTKPARSCISRLALPGAAAMAMAMAPQTLAVGHDPVEFFVSQTITRDGNVFRLSEGVDPLPITGHERREDVYHTTEVGVDVELPVSRQTLRGSFAAQRIRFEQFRELDHDGYRGGLLWEWSVGNRWSGGLGYERSKRLTSLANLISGVQTSTANFLTASETLGGIRYKLTGHWSLVFDAAEVEHENSAAVSRLSDALIRERELALRYETRTGSTFGISGGTREGDLPNPQIVAGEPVDNSYEQREYAAELDWIVSAESRLQLSGGRITREHRSLPGRDFQGDVYRIGYDWRPTEKLSLTASRERGISPWEQVNVGFVLLERTTLQSRWKVTEKLAVTATRSDGVRTRLGEPALGLTAAEPRTEDVATSRLAIDYRPTHFLTLSLQWRDEARRTAAGPGDFRTDIVSLEVRGIF